MALAIELAAARFAHPRPRQARRRPGGPPAAARRRAPRPTKQHGSVRACSWSAGLLTNVDLTVFGGSRSSWRLHRSTPPPRWPRSRRWSGRTRSPTAWPACGPEPPTPRRRRRGVATGRWSRSASTASNNSPPPATSPSPGRHLGWCLRTSGRAGAGRSRRRGPGGPASATSPTTSGPRSAGRPTSPTCAGRRRPGLGAGRGRLRLAGESQQRYEQAAGLSDDPSTAAAALRSAAGVCAADVRRRHVPPLPGRGGRRPARRRHRVRRRDLATAATAFYRMSGVFARLPCPARRRNAPRQRRGLAGDDPRRGPRSLRGVRRPRRRVLRRPGRGPVDGGDDRARGTGGGAVPPAGRPGRRVRRARRAHRRPTPGRRQLRRRGHGASPTSSMLSSEPVTPAPTSSSTR